MVSLSEDATTALILQCHHIPLVIPEGVPEHVYANAFVVFTEASVAGGKVFLLDLVLAEHGSETPRVSEVALDCEFNLKLQFILVEDAIEDVAAIAIRHCWVQFDFVLKLDGVAPRHPRDWPLTG